MDYRYGGQIRKAIHDFVQNPQANLIVSFTILAAAMYVSLAAIVGRQLLHPYEHMKLSANSTMDEMISSSFSIFFFWISSVVVGYLATLAKLPSLFGSLLVGFFITNIPALSNVVYLNDYWHYIIRKLCLVCIIIRWGLGINGTYIRENPAYPLALGVLSAIAEAAVIAIVSVIFFNIPIEFGVIGGFMLATVSPAVCGPVMIKLQKQDLGTDKNIPCFVPAACCFDNTFSIITVTLMSAVTFTNESKFGNLVRNVGEMILCGIIGIFIGMTAINHGFPGVVACLILCFVAPSRWRTDNPKKLVPVANFFAKLWNYVASPLLFSLVGTFLDFNRVVTSCIVAVLITAPIGAFVLDFTAPLLVKKSHSAPNAVTTGNDTNAKDQNDRKPTESRRPSGLQRLRAVSLQIGNAGRRVVF
ncbi:unnamed protein product [Nippostrongylus brasiliensis]|uniref:Na_H_Exchanger domain-containing protein n=1 Tax=Nippostrongylus brasiliensis TaxID=27835 RepID=A0A0N4Y026_NIPBR|nr:unnamed protein product [Nippostrongylus brasiliensis]